MAQLFKLVLTFTLLKLVVKPSLILADYNPSYSLNEICEARCDHHRPRGYFGKFNFNCDELSTEELWDDCRNDCTDCPEAVCAISDTNSYHCPETYLTGPCKAFCDQNRKNGTTRNFQVSCLTNFENPDDLEKCRKICYICPNYVCNLLDKNLVFHCPGEDPPTGKPPKIRAASITTLTTTQTSVEISPAETRDSNVKDQTPFRPPSMNIEGRSIGGPDETEQEDQDSSERNVTRNATREKELTYEGPCKTRCDKFRLGGTKEYDFKCDDLFETDGEQDICKLDCLQCPRKICPRKLNYVFLCPKSSATVDQLDLGPLGLVFLITTIILAFVCVTIGAFYCCRRSGHGRLVSEDITTSGHQIEYIHQVPQQRKKQPGHAHAKAPMKIVSSDSIL